MTPQQFIAKWQRANLTERSACQQHFLDLCELLDQEKPAAADPDGTWYTFERGVRTTADEQGWADVWKRGHFGWEYKGKHKNLDDAYTQLQRYREALENPPMLVVCDLDRFEIHTNFTGTAKRVYKFDLDGLADPANLDVLRKLFSNPEALRPGLTTATITEQAAERFGKLADGMRQRGVPAHDAAHFLMKLMFCMFGEDVHLLPEKVFGKVLEGAKNDPAKLSQRLTKLFEAMSRGGDFGTVDIPYFNGGLFDDADVVPLRPGEIETLIDINTFDWSSVEPSVFGTLFERTLDPAKRSQIGAHYTSKEDILTLLEPVMMAPLRREWDGVKAQCEELWPKIQIAARKKQGKSARSLSSAAKDSAARKKFDNLLHDFTARIAKVKVLDPACGSGNFLYVAIKLLLDLEKEVILYGAQHGEGMLPGVRPTQLAGIEINPYAQELASVVIWIGYLQWMHDNGFGPRMNPVLEPIESIKLMDAILDLSDPESPKEPEWPAADFIVGNPPFLGGNRIRQGLGDEYVDALFKTYRERVPGFADLCCYWFEKARAQIKTKACGRVGLLATQGIRGGVNRRVLERIRESGDIFFAIGDREWILEGAAVHVSLVGFDDGAETRRSLDGRDVSTIEATLSDSINITGASQLRWNQSIHIEGVKKGADFEVDDESALSILLSPNPHGRPTSDVLRPYINGTDLNGGVLPEWLVYFPSDWREDDAAMYESVFARVQNRVFPKYGTRRKKWWVLERPRPELDSMVRQISRYLAIVKHAKHRIFVWVPATVLVSNAIELFATDDNFFFGVVQSLIHEKWAMAPGVGTQVREKESGFRYTPTTCFETFPFPEPTDERRQMIAAVARELDQLRTNWLNPPEWVREEVLEFPGSADGPWARYVHDPDARGIGTVRYPRTVAKDEKCAEQLAKRSLTNLYNQRPTWLDLAHRRLDEAVFAAYGWDPTMTDDQLLEKLLALNLQRAAAERTNT